jgi:hypothetical protein
LIYASKVLKFKSSHLNLLKKFLSERSAPLENKFQASELRIFETAEFYKYKYIFLTVRVKTKQKINYYSGLHFFFLSLLLKLFIILVFKKKNKIKCKPILEEE